MIGANLRVCSGTAKGRTLKSTPGIGLRPTSARVRQAIFSTLSHRVEGRTVLDLYAGTGALGIEALSRGASEATFVEISPKCLKIIRDNLEVTAFSGKANVRRGDVLRVLRDFGRQNRTFDVVLADPPYEVKRQPERSTSLAEKTLKVMMESGILRRDSLVILEHRGGGRAIEATPGLTRVSSKKYGDTLISVFRLEQPPTE